MRLLVMGAGGTGGYFGGKLARAGVDVTFVARGAHAEAIRRHGLTVRSATDGTWTVRAPVVADPAGLPPADLVLFCVKTFDTEAAARLIRPAVGAETGVLSIQNGVDAVDTLGRLLGPAHVMAGAAQVFATIAEPGVIVHTAAGRILFGELDGADSARSRAFEAACGAAGIPVERTPDVRRTLWEKYVMIVAHAGTTALTRCPVGVIRRVPETRGLYRTLLEEMTRLARAAGMDVAADYPDRVMGFLDAQPPGTLSSLHHDLAHGRRLELESLHGHAARLGERLGVPVPAVATVYAALKPYVDGPPAPAA